MDSKLILIIIQEGWENVERRIRWLLRITPAHNFPSPIRLNLHDLTSKLNHGQACYQTAVTSVFG